MDQKERTYLAIDLKSFYASVECRERGLDPMTTNLVVADASRTEKTICLAVSPSLKSYGIPGRARLFEVIQKVEAINAERRRRIPGHVLFYGGYDNTVTQAHPEETLNYIVAPPRMALYIELSHDETHLWHLAFRYRLLLPHPALFQNGQFRFYRLVS